MQLELFNQDGSGLRTWKELYPQDSREIIGVTQKGHRFSFMSLESWNDWVTGQKQEYSQRKKLGCRTKDEESSSWPTPNASVEKYRLQGNSEQSKSLEAMGRRGELCHPDPENPNTHGNHRGQSMRLSPRWVEVLMGLPVGWVMPSCANPTTVDLTNSLHSEMGWSRQLHPKHF